MRSARARDLPTEPPAETGRPGRPTSAGRLQPHVTTWRAICAGVCVALAIVGCIGKPQNPAATQPVTISDPATTQPLYWFDQPASVTVEGRDFDKLVAAADEALRQHDFAIDRMDYRLGLVTSRPLVSSQFFEFWRSDVATPADSADASIATMRRTVRFDIKRRSDGTCELAPKVLVERQAIAERRITSVVLYKGSFQRVSPRDQPSGSKESDEGFQIPPRYWYAVGRDPALEKNLANDIRRELAKSH